MRHECMSLWLYKHRHRSLPVAISKTLTTRQPIHRIDDVALEILESFRLVVLTLYACIQTRYFNAPHVNSVLSTRQQIGTCWMPGHAVELFGMREAVQAHPVLYAHEIGRCSYVGGPDDHGFVQ
jgi:hypothetical protein